MVNANFAELFGFVKLCISMLLVCAWFSVLLLMLGGGCRVGCMLAGFLLNREPFFRGKDNEDQLLRIALVLGTQGLFDFLRKYGKEMN